MLDNDLQLRSVKFLSAYFLRFSLVDLSYNSIKYRNFMLLLESIALSDNT